MHLRPLSLLSSGREQDTAWFTFLHCSLLVVALSGCVPRAENEVTLYAAADREFATPILDGFERSKPDVSIVRQYDIESSKTLGLVARIEGEAKNPKCDCFWNNEIMHTLRLQKKGLLQSRRWPIPDTWPKAYRSSDGTWVGFAARARVLLINKQKLPDPLVWPQSVLELASPKWKSRCGLAFPIYGTTATHMAVLASHAEIVRSQNQESPWMANTHLDWSRWIEAVKSNAIVLAGNKQVAIAVGRGDLDWCLTDTDDAMIEKESGQPVELVFPDQGVGEIGTLFIPNTLAVLRNAPHPVAAAELANYLIGEKVESRLVMSDGAHFPIWPTSTESSRAAPGAPIRWAEVSFEKAADRWENLIDQLQRLFANN